MFASQRVNLFGFKASDIDILEVELSPDGRNATVWWDVTSYTINEIDVEELQKVRKEKNLKEFTEACFQECVLIPAFFEISNRAYIF